MYIIVTKNYFAFVVLYCDRHARPFASFVMNLNISKPGPEVIIFFMLHSAEHEKLNALKYKKLSRNSAFSGSDKPKMLFCLLINVEMTRIVGILTVLSRKSSMLS